MGDRLVSSLDNISGYDNFPCFYDNYGNVTERRLGRDGSCEVNV